MNPESRLEARICIPFVLRQDRDGLPVRNPEPHAERAEIGLEAFRANALLTEQPFRDTAR